MCLRESRPLVFLLILQIAFARHTRTQCRIDHARKAEKLITLIAIPAYDPTIKVNIILIISARWTYTLSRRVLDTGVMDTRLDNP